MTDLACCPFCGRPAKLMNMGYDPEKGPWGVFCTADSDPQVFHGHSIENYATKEEAAEAWNAWPRNGVDEIRRQMGYLSHERNNFEQLMGSRDHWREKAQVLESEAMHREMEIDERYTELPVDADGVHIRIGDRLSYCGESFIVDGFEFYEWGWRACGELDGRVFRVMATSCHHIPKPEPPERTIEDVLHGFLDAMGDASEGRPEDMDGAQREAFAKYAEELREMLGVKE